MRIAGSGYGCGRPHPYLRVLRKNTNFVNGADLKKRWRLVLLILFVLLIVCSLVHPFGNMKKVQSDRPLLQGAQVPPEVMGVVQRSCRDCHSEQTSWPLYSYIAPMSWLVESDVSEGRSLVNMSHWDELSLDDREEKLSKIASMVRNKKMPLPQYTLIHRDAKLSDAETNLLYEWAHAERKRLKASEAPAQPAK
jgi:hypothetical protein